MTSSNLALVALLCARTISLSPALAHAAEPTPTPKQKTVTKTKRSTKQLACEKLKKEASAGSANAQYDLGEDFYNGYNQPQDLLQAAFWHRKAAKQGLANAQYDLANAYGHL